MENRAHPRQPIYLDAFLTSKKGLKPRLCKIRDFCPGGMFIETELKDNEELKSQQVEIHFSLDKGYCVTANVVRVFKAGIGIAFPIGLDAVILRALHNLVKTQAFVTEASKPYLIESKVLKYCIKVIEKESKQIIADFLQQFKKKLLSSATSANSNIEQDIYFECVDSLKRDADVIMTGFCQQVLDQTHHIGSSVLISNHDNASSEGLSLVEKQDFEILLSIAELVSELENQHSEELFGIERRWSYLIKKDVSKDHNPIGPSQLCHIWYQQICSLLTDKAVIVIGFYCFRQAMKQHSQDLYKSINKVFIAHNILPDLNFEQAKADYHRSSKPKNKSHSDTEEVNIKDAGDVISATKAPTDSQKTMESDTNAVENQTQQSVASPSLHTDMYQLVDTLLQLKDNVKETTLPHAHAVTSNQKVILEKLSNLQQEIDDIKSLSLGEITATIKQQAIYKELPKSQASTIDVFSKLFHAVSDDEYATDYIKQWLSVLEFPLIKTALADSNFLYNQKHPAKKTLDHLSYLANLVDIDNIIINKKLKHTIESSIKQLSDSEQVSVNDFEQINQILEKLVQKEKTIYQRNVDRVIQSCEGQQQREQAKMLVCEKLEQAFVGEPLPKILLSLLDAGWQDLLVFTLLREGENSQRFKTYFDLVLRLLPHLNGDSFNPEQAALIIHEINSGLESIAIDPFKRQSIVEQLKQNITQPKQSYGDCKVIQAEDLFKKIGKKSKQQSFTQQIDKLNAGDWVFLQKRKQTPKQKAQLIWLSPDRERYVFVNAYGIKIADLSAQELEQQFVGAVPQISDSLSFVDNSLYHIIQEMHQQLVHQATYDELTQLLNRREFERQLEQVFASIQQQPLDYVLCYLDLDQFKIVNNTCGHKAGDSLLKQVADILKQDSDEFALVGRLGGDEFAVLLKDCSEKLGYKIAEQYRYKIQSLDFCWENYSFPITVSMGLVFVNEHSHVDAVLKSADSACFVAKNMGRNRIHCYHADDVSVLDQDNISFWGSKISQILANNQLRLRCQKIVPTNTDKHYFHYEVLLSIADEDGKLLPPMDFIQAAEFYTRMPEVDRWVVNQVINWIVANPDKLKNFDGFAINLSGQSLSDPEFMTFVLGMMHDNRIPKAKVCFEITETVAIANLDKAIKFIEKVKDFGCRFSLDDFGTGLSSYSYLKTLPVDYLKIDGSFIREIVSNSNDYAMVTSINEIGHFMNKKTIAEYVENQEILAVINKIGIDYAQGYGVAQPLFLEQIA